MISFSASSMEPSTSTVVTSNFSSSPGPTDHVSMDSRGLVPAVILSFCFLLGVPGNISVIILKSKWQHLSSLSQTLMLNLAAADLLCLLTMPMWIYSLFYGWIFGLVLCKIVYVIYCSIYCSLLTVTMLSVQRYLQVVYLQRSLGQRGQKRLLVLLWLVAIVMSTHALVLPQLKTDQLWTQCQGQYTMAQILPLLVMESFIGFVSLFVVMFTYISIHRKVHQGAFFNNPQTTRLVTSIVVTFFVLWIPYHIFNVVGILAVSLNNEGLINFCKDSRNTVCSLTFVNSCLNPLLYAFASSNMCKMCTRCQNT